MKCLLLLLSTSLCFATSAQYKYDNVAFKTVYWEDLCKTLDQSPGYLLLDVRSKGEHFDTSSSKSLNIGHLKGATNIDIREIGSRIKEIDSYKSKPVFVYCSHSQRSRRVSKQLADSGFLHVFNINGGVSNLRMFDWKEDCNLLTSALSYQIISPLALTPKKMADYFIVDVRTDSAFRGIAAQERRNALGKFKTAINLPVNTLEQNLASLPKNKNILLVDELGNESAAAAELLNKNGYKSVAILFNGLDGYLSEVAEKDRTGWVNTVRYHTINSVTFDKLAKADSPVFLDIRSSDEFNNAAKEGFRNIGKLEGAINLPYADVDKQLETISIAKEKPIVVYGFSTQNEVFETAKKLSAQGYTNVNVLLGGLFHLRWRAANIKGYSHLKDWVVNVPADNQ